jgi:hypothetical protein
LGAEKVEADPLAVHARRSVASLALVGRGYDQTKGWPSAPPIRFVEEPHEITTIDRGEDAAGPRFLLKQNIGAPLVKGVTPPETELIETLDEAWSRAKEIGGEVEIIEFPG